MIRLAARHGRALHRAIRRHRAKLMTQHQQALNRLHRKRYGSCERKARYHTRAEAERRRDSQTRLCTVYPCQFCNGYHLTSKT